MLEFTRMVTTWYSQIDNLSTPSLLRLFRGRGDARQALRPRQAAPARRPKREREEAEAGVASS